MIGLDFLFFGKLRVLLLVHTATRYTFAFPVQDPVEQDVLTFGKFVRILAKKLHNRVKEYWLNRSKIQAAGQRKCGTSGFCCQAGVLVKLA